MVMVGWTSGSDNRVTVANRCTIPYSPRVSVMSAFCELQACELVHNTNKVCLLYRKTKAATTKAAFLYGSLHEGKIMQNELTNKIPIRTFEASDATVSSSLPQTKKIHHNGD